MDRLTLGDLELTVFSDGTYPLDGGAFFGVVPKVLWSKKVTVDERNLVTAGLNSLVVRMETLRAGRQTVLIETGIGNKLSDRMVKIYGQPAKLLDNLAAAGIAPEDIDIVINSHLHFDHCGWNTVRDGKGKIIPTFPRAQYYAPAGEWEYARHPSERDAISYISDNYDPLVASGQMELLKGGEEIVPGISVEIFPGHTTSMMGVVVRSCHSEAARSSAPKHLGESPCAVAEGDRNGARDEHPYDAPLHTACYISDLIPTAGHVDLTWGMGFDLYPLQTIESKKRYYARAIPEKWLTVFTHDPKTPWGYVGKDEKGKMVAKAVV
ncbi:MAG TPA: MBL fold metallo-hydrolase [Silvibacterium sp.]|nr:MBL fold metallo-hydrolase [Silvibacterium sp.]